MSRDPGNHVDRADVILHSGRVLTLDGRIRKASAVALRAGKILAVDNDRAVSALAEEGTKAIDLGGRSVVPGFIETHTHPYFFGLTLDAAVDAESPPNESVADIVERVRAAARTCAAQRSLT